MTILKDRDFSSADGSRAVQGQSGNSRRLEWNWQLVAKMNAKDMPTNFI